MRAKHFHICCGCAFYPWHILLFSSIYTTCLSNNHVYCILAGIIFCICQNLMSWKQFFAIFWLHEIPFPHDWHTNQQIPFLLDLYFWDFSISLLSSIPLSSQHLPVSTLPYHHHLVQDDHLLQTILKLLLDCPQLQHLCHNLNASWVTSQASPQVQSIPQMFYQSLLCCYFEHLLHVCFGRIDTLFPWNLSDRAMLKHWRMDCASFPFY